MSKSAPKQSAELPKRIRIIGGVWRSRLLDVIDLPDLRPTTDRIRETLFNWLGQDLSGLRCLDVFAGTGVLGFEAASRGAASVQLLEKNKKAYLALTSNLTALQSSPVAGVVQIDQQDGLEFLKRQADQSFDLIFIDPPFQDEGLFNQALSESSRVCSPSSGGCIYVEFPASRSLEEIKNLLPAWDCGKCLEAGQVKACLFIGRND